MIEEKAWYRSRTIWGSLIAAGAALGGLFGHGLDPVAQADIADALTRIGGAAGALYAVWARLNATRVLI